MIRSAAQTPRLLILPFAVLSMVYLLLAVGTILWLDAPVIRADATLGSTKAALLLAFSVGAGVILVAFAIARYVLTDSRNATDSSLMVPYLPRHTLAVGATWINPNGWYLAGLLTHRSHRYADEANTASLGAGISGDLDVFRESRDKRWLLRFSANDLFDRDRDSQFTAELNYRF
jgi:outer membrane receptor protein involved in Fe transport